MAGFVACVLGAVVWARFDLHVVGPFAFRRTAGAGIRRYVGLVTTAAAVVYVATALSGGAAGQLHQAAADVSNYSVPALGLVAAAFACGFLRPSDISDVTGEASKVPLPLRPFLLVLERFRERAADLYDEVRRGQNNEIHEWVDDASLHLRKAGITPAAIRTMAERVLAGDGRSREVIDLLGRAGDLRTAINTAVRNKMAEQVTAMMIALPHETDTEVVRPVLEMRRALGEPDGLLRCRPGAVRVSPIRMTGPGAGTCTLRLWRRPWFAKVQVKPRLESGPGPGHWPMVTMVELDRQGRPLRWRMELEALASKRTRLRLWYEPEFEESAVDRSYFFARGLYSVARLRDDMQRWAATAASEQ